MRAAKRSRSAPAVAPSARASARAHHASASTSFSAPVYGSLHVGQSCHGCLPAQVPARACSAAAAWTAQRSCTRPADPRQPQPGESSSPSSSPLPLLRSRQMKHAGGAGRRLQGFTASADFGGSRSCIPTRPSWVGQRSRGRTTASFPLSSALPLRSVRTTTSPGAKSASSITRRRKKIGTQLRQTQSLHGHTPAHAVGTPTQSHPYTTHIQYQPYEASHPVSVKNVVPSSSPTPSTEAGLPPPSVRAW